MMNDRRWHIRALALLVAGAGSLVAGESRALPFGPETCKIGYVWREACGPNDHVCVPGATRSQAAADNAAAASRRVGNATYGPDACAAGYVWREACGPQDHVCVTRATRTRAGRDNAAAAGRFAKKPVLWDVLTQHDDPERTGLQRHEQVLTPANVTPSTFGRLYERGVDGQIIAQPLYVSNQWIPGQGLRNVVYVATRNNTVYAFDADNLDPDPTHGLLWSAKVGHASTVPGLQAGQCSESVGPIGVNSTPVIDRANNTLYVVARHDDGKIYLHALDITDGHHKAMAPGAQNPMRIQPGALAGVIFDSGLELNRAGLLLQDGAVFVAFSALVCDNAGWHGWVLAYRAPDLQPVGEFVTSPNSTSPGAGIWQSGNGLVGDGHNVYFATGNRQGGTPAASALDESFIKLSVGPAPFYGLTPAGHYTVNNREPLNGGDTDLGSGGPLLAPGGVLIGGGKQGKLYLLDSSSMTPTQFPPVGPSVPGGNDGFQAYVNTWHDDASQPECTDVSLLARSCYMPHYRYEQGEALGPNIHTGPVYWAAANPAWGLLYAMPEKDLLRSYRFTNASHLLNTTPHAVSSVRSPDGMPGAFLSVSANGGSHGIVWASMTKADGQWQNGPGRLVAFDALTLAELWRDDDDIGFAKFNPPTVAGGKVFRPTFADKLLVYGLTSAATPSPCYTIAQKYQNYTGANGLLGASTSPETTAPDGIGHYQHYAAGSIYWTPTTCAWEVHGSIHAEWSGLGWEAGFLGYPVTDETGTPDGRGRYNHFQGGSVYWTALTGAHEVHGLIRGRWAALGWEQSALGYPISDETDELDGSGRFSLFEHGSIHWNRTSGVVTVQTLAGALMSPMHAGFDRLGSDFFSVAIPSANPVQCQQQCTDSATCQAWTFVNAGVQGPQAQCYLKNPTPLEGANSCCTSGVKVDVHPAGMTPMLGRIDLPGADIANFDLPTPDALLCQGECGHNASCQAWTYREPDALHAPHCWFKQPIPAQAANGLTISGHK